MSMMEELPSISQLECFIIYGRVQNFTQAAKEANITQSAFSAQMKKLEATLGVTLIQRSKRGSHLTPAGERFLARISDWMEELHKIVYDLRTAEGAEQMELNVGILRTLGDIQMNRHIAHFREQNSRIRFNVYDLEREQLFCALMDDRLDVVSSYLLPEMPAAELVIEHFCWDNIVYYAPLLDLPQEPVTVDTILASPVVLYPKQFIMNDTIVQYCKGAGKRPHTAARLSTPYAMAYYCQQNPAGALLPERLLETMGCRQGIYPLVKPLRTDACLIYKKDSPKIRLIQTYVDYVLASFHAAQQAPQKQG